MDIRAPEQQYNPYRIFTREQWARLRDDTPMTLEPGEFERLRSMHDRLDLQEVEDCWFIAGDDSYMLKVRAGDVDDLERTIRRLSGTKGVSRTRTTIVLSTKWENRVGQLPDEDPL